MGVGRREVSLRLGRSVWVREGRRWKERERVEGEGEGRRRGDTLGER